MTNTNKQLVEEIARWIGIKPKKADETKQWAESANEEAFDTYNAKVVAAYEALQHLWPAIHAALLSPRAREDGLEEAAKKARSALEAMMILHGPDVAGLSLMVINELDRALASPPALAPTPTKGE